MTQINTLSLFSGMGVQMREELVNISSSLPSSNPQIYVPVPP